MKLDESSKQALILQSRIAGTLSYGSIAQKLREDCILGTCTTAGNDSIHGLTSHWTISTIRRSLTNNPPLPIRILPNSRPSRQRLTHHASLSAHRRFSLRHHIICRAARTISIPTPIQLSLSSSRHTDRSPGWTTLILPR